jgi:hypothetical protein
MNSLLEDSAWVVVAAVCMGLKVLVRLLIEVLSSASLLLEALGIKL